MAILKQEPASIPVTGGRLPPISLSTNCPSCGIALDPEELAEQAYVCDCGHHFRMHAEAWLALLADATTWQERWADVRPHDLLEWRLPKPYQETIDQAREEGLNEAVRTGTCRLGGRPIWLAVFDFRFVGGTLSIVAGERLARGLEAAGVKLGDLVTIGLANGADGLEDPSAVPKRHRAEAKAGDREGAEWGGVHAKHPTS